MNVQDITVFYIIEIKHYYNITMNIGEVIEAVLYFGRDAQYE